MPIILFAGLWAYWAAAKDIFEALKLLGAQPCPAKGAGFGKRPLLQCGRCGRRA